MDRREALRALVALPAVSHIARASVGRGDVIVVECADHLRDADIANIAAGLKQIWPDNKIVVLGGGLHLRIMASEST